MKDLSVTWNKLTLKYTENGRLVDELWIEIEKAYTSKRRHYHNLAHLAYMIERAIRYSDQLYEHDTVMFSIFYHDIIYNTGRQDNEQKSADIAHDRLTRLEVPVDKIMKCQCQIMATKDHKDNADSDTNFLVDFDLAILGDTPKTYEEYTKKIRSEYTIYPNFLYKKGRKKVLQHFLAMDRIFKTHEFHSRYEKQARENLRTELRQL